MNNTTNYFDEEAYEEYFKGLNRPESEKPKTKEKEELTNPDGIVHGDSYVERLHLKEISKQAISFGRYFADDNINDIEHLAEILKELCNAAWGSGWGTLSMDLIYGEDSAKITLPQITVDVNQRDISEIGTFKPILMDIEREEDENGNETGDAFLLYRQWFDQNVEFNFYGHNSKEARDLMRRFEKLILAYTGYIKRLGISEIFFLKEVAPQSSLNFKENTPMRCVYYYVRTETIIPIRVSMINKINAQIGAEPIDVIKLERLIEDDNVRTEIELDFFNGDNGITYKPTL